MVCSNLILIAVYEPHVRVVNIAYDVAIETRNEVVFRNENLTKFRKRVRLLSDCSNLLQLLNIPGSFY